ncbi:tyrosine-protein kinase family protein [Paenibacillus sp. SI8]|uniref:tyrosine-protein kinase family protein n=1 Tax=unclassified Paenibacillus TaxID=185978 RepID=UPI00346745B4
MRNRYIGFKLWKWRGKKRENQKRSTLDALRKLRSFIYLRERGNHGYTLLFTTCNYTPCSSSLVCYYSLLSADSNKKTLLIDANLHRSNIHNLLGCDNDIGLTNVLLGDSTVEHAIRNIPGTNLDVMTSGPITDSPSDLMYRHFNTIVKAISQSYDHIIIDSPPLIEVSDTQSIAAIADGVVLVLNARHTKKKQAEVAREILDSINATVLGMIYNDEELPAGDYSKNKGY